MRKVLHGTVPPNNPDAIKSLPNLTDPMPYIVVPCKDTTITIQDYCDARFFPVHRAMYIFVWAMAPSGCLSGTDDARLRYWVDEVSARAPGSVVAMVGTHKDRLSYPSLLPQTLQRLHETFQSYVGDALFLCATFSVSCKDRTCASEQHGGPTNIKGMFEYLAEVCAKQSASDREFPAARMPSPGG